MTLWSQCLARMDAGLSWQGAAPPRYALDLILRRGLLRPATLVQGDEGGRDTGFPAALLEVPDWEAVKAICAIPKPWW